MTKDELKALNEIKSTATPLSNLHPLKLDRWWRALVGAPEAIYMQLGSAEIFQQIDNAARAITAMLDLLGADNIPVSHHELAQRHISRFRLHVSREDGQPAPFLISWNKENQNWEVACPLEQDTIKIVENLEKAITVCEMWSKNLKEVGAQVDEKIEESESITDGV